MPRITIPVYILLITQTVTYFVCRRQRQFFRLYLGSRILARINLENEIFQKQKLNYYTGIYNVLNNMMCQSDSLMAILIISQLKYTVTSRIK